MNASPTQADPPQAQEVNRVLDLLVASAGLATEMERGDLADRLKTAAARMRRPSTVVCVVGEFKQGKSSLVNALLGRAVCPVDDDLATSALTLLHHGDELRVEVRRRIDGEAVTEAIDLGSLRKWVTEAGNPENEKGVERVDIAFPAEVLAGGLVLVDSPGMGSMGAGHGASTLAFLPWADALVFVTDATAELSAPEVEFLGRARELCPNVVVALTKTDIVPEWRRIADLDRSHLASAGVDAVVLPLSTILRWRARDRSDPELDRRSGYPDLERTLERDVIGPAKELAARRAEAEVTLLAEQLSESISAELSALTDPAGREEIARRADEASAKLEHLRGPGARWSLLVADRITDLSNDVSFAFRGALRGITRSAEEDIEQLKTQQEWDELGRRLQTEVADAVTAAFQRLDNDAVEIEREVVELIAEELGDLPGVVDPLATIDVESRWVAKSLDPKVRRGGQAAGSTLTGLRGAQSGIIMFGMMARFLPAGIGAVMLATPVMLGAGVAFAGFQILDAKKRKVAQRRQQARVNLRQFVDDVQFEVTNGIGESVRSIQRSFRDGVGERMGELQRSYAETARAAAEAAQRDARETAERVEVLRARLVRLEQLRGGAPVPRETP